MEGYSCIYEALSVVVKLEKTILTLCNLKEGNKSNIFRQDISDQ
jgi:hypothetical protein